MVRYVASTLSSGREIVMMSSGDLFSGKTYSSVGTTVTVTSTSHGLTTGDYVVIRGGTDSYLYAEVTVTNSNEFTFVSGTSGASGSDLAYIPAFGISSYTESGATVNAPSAGNCQVHSMTATTGTTTSSTFALVVPTSINNGAGDNNSATDQNPPIVQVWKLSDGGYNASGKIGTISTSGTFNTYTVTAINTFVNNIIRLQF